MPYEIYISSHQHTFTDDPLVRRVLTPDEVQQHALEERPGWLAWHLGRIGDEGLIEAALAADPDLAADLEPRMLDSKRIGIVVDDALVTRLTTALSP